MYALVLTDGARVVCVFRVATGELPAVGEDDLPSQLVRNMVETKIAGDRHFRAAAGVEFTWISERSVLPIFRIQVIIPRGEQRLHTYYKLQAAEISNVRGLEQHSSG